MDTFGGVRDYVFYLEFWSDFWHGDIWDGGIWDERKLLVGNMIEVENMVSE